MGYRSDVAFVIVTNNPKEAMGLLATWKLGLSPQEHKDAVWIDKDAIRIEVKDGAPTLICYEEKQLKWYDGEACTDILKKLLTLAENLGYPSNFIRLGNEMGDIEEEEIIPRSASEQTQCGLRNVLEVRREIDWAIPRGSTNLTPAELIESVRENETDET